MYLCVCAPAYTHVFEYAYEYVSEYVYEYAYAYVYMYMHVYKYIYIYIYICMYALYVFDVLCTEVFAACRGCALGNRLVHSVVHM